MGAEIFGADLSEDLDGETFGEIHQALLDHGAIFFRDQDITPQHQLNLARRWGNVHVHPHMPCLSGFPGVIEIVKKEDDTVAFGGNWHTDQMFTPTPARVTMLYAKEIPAAGGDTQFANLYLAYDTLSDGMKAMIGDLRTISQYDKKKKRPANMKPTDEDIPAPEVEHPLVRPHTETGRKALYISYEGITRRIAGMTEAESRPLLSYLMDHATRPEFVCRFRWQPGTLGLWDNRRALHFPINDYNGYRRVMHRVTVEGEATS
jgi:taurine dioxygenase